MGSLPNLHELGKENHDYQTPRPGQTLLGTTFTHEERTKVLHRYSDHSRIRKIRSNGNNFKIMYDDLMLEHMATYSPISSRSTRNLAMNLKRKDSLSSSIGATSVRRLLAVVRPNIHTNHPTRDNPSSKRVLLSNFIILCVVHTIVTATFLPFLALQTSVSVWALPPVHSININIGSLLLSVVYIFTSISTLFGPSLVQKLGANIIFVISYLVFCIFYSAHLYPSIYLLLPVSILLGIVLGPLNIAQIIFLMTLSSKISYIHGEDDEDTKSNRKTCVVRRLARGFQAAHDFGLIFGSILSTLLISHTITINNNQYSINGNFTDANISCFTAVTAATTTTTTTTNLTSPDNCTKDLEDFSLTNYNLFLDEIFDTFEGTRLCGAQACPPNLDISNNNNSSDEYFRILPKNSTTALAIVYAVLCFLASMISGAGLDRIRTYIYQDPLERPVGLTALKSVKESFRDNRLRMAAPLALFIGFEQAFIYADFSKSYVVCTLGIHRLNLVFLSMGILQSIAACTLSMLIRSIKRYYVVAVGFTFHACLLMVLTLWKPVEDDPALFYVISAAWGVCNAIWEMLNFTLLTGSFNDNWESAFANLLFYRFIGLSLAFTFHEVLCNYYKLYALGFFLVLAVIPYTWLEFRLENLRKIKNMTRL